MTGMPQQHCADMSDHEAHEWHGYLGSQPIWSYRCPGRWTPRGLVTNEQLATPDDPFDGLAD